MQQLEALISSLIGQSSTFGTAVLTSEHLLKILDQFKGMRKVVMCKVCALIYTLFSSEHWTSNMRINVILFNTVLGYY